MKSLLLSLTTCVTLFLVSCNETKVIEENPILTIEGGQIQGVICDSSDVIVYRGIPYAAPPTGENRWKKPQPVIPWDGVLLADHFCDPCIQPQHDANDGGYGREFFWQGDPKFSEDCLYLNVWTPKGAAGNPDKKLPVAFWVHGGGYNAGWGFEPEMDGEAWAQKNVVLVTINYRLNMFGFLNHPELTSENPDGVSGNYGTYDQVAALKWVYDNIAQFGGNPKDITILGQSAGAASIKNLVISPFSKNMVKKAIIQSGGGLGTFIPERKLTQEQLDSVGKAIMDGCGYTSLKEMRAVGDQELYDAVNKYMKDNHSFLMMTPHQDGILLDTDFNSAVYDNTVADVPYMIGYTENDLMDLGDQINLFCEVRDSLSPDKPTYSYLFSRQLPGDDKPSMKGAFHSSELWYQFGTLKRSWRPFTEADYKLSEEMVTAWTNFCKFGNPNGESSNEWAPSKKNALFTKNFDVK